MNWFWLRLTPWVDTRARFVSQVPRGGTLLDLGSSDGETLTHISQLRPDLKLHAADRHCHPERYPAGCEFRSLDFERDLFPWPDRSMHAVTCMHVIEHLRDFALLLRESARVLKPGGRIYLETPHPRSLKLASPMGKAAGTFTLNFFDDPTHVRLVEIPALQRAVHEVGLRGCASGISRNWLFAASHPLFLLAPPSRKKFTALIHWIGWSAYLVAQRPP